MGERSEGEKRGERSGGEGKWMTEGAMKEEEKEKVRVEKGRREIDGRKYGE